MITPEVLKLILVRSHIDVFLKFDAAALIGRVMVGTTLYWVREGRILRIIK